MSVLLFLLFTATRPLIISDLKCESVANPMNVDVVRPRLSWIVSSPDEGQRQSGYRILVASRQERLVANQGDLWDTGKVNSNATIEVPYAGHPLRSAEEVYWKVQVWDANGNPSKWSAENHWTMGLLSPLDWKAKWIGAGEDAKQPVTMQLRRSFAISKPVRKALLFVSGLGQYEMWLNGLKVGADWLTPGWTQYAKTVLADSYDVTSLVQGGANALSLHVGNGMYDMFGDKRGGQQPNSLGHKKAVCQLMLQYWDRTSDTIVSDGSWKWSPSSETYSGVFGGEDWVDHKGQFAWRLADFDDSNWPRVTEMTPPKGVLRGLTHAAPPLRTIEIRTPKKITRPEPNILVVDLGQNAPYVPRITLSSYVKRTVKLTPGEVLKPDGTVNQQTMRGGKYASYAMSVSGIETWNPSFWYCGSKYWQIEATDDVGRAVDPTPLLLKFEGLMVHADIKPVGHFECSNKLFNETHNLIWWAMASNFASVISDCPHREKSGWLEQDHLMGPGLMYCFDMSAMFRKVIEDMHDTQLQNGMVPTMAPEYFIYDGGFRDSVEWGGAYLLLPEMVQSWYGKRGLVAEHYDAMKRYVDYLGTQAKDGVLSNGLGDWNGGGADPRTPVGITDTCYFYDMATTLAKFASSLGKRADAAHYRDLATSIRERFNAKFVDPETGRVGTGSQSGQATALDLGLIGPRLEQKAFDKLLEDVVAHDYSVSCGEVGHPSLLRVLTRFGRADVVARIHLQTDRPGYGYQIKKGLTTLAESWDASLISYNHFMLGHIMEWFYGDLVGIKPDPTGVAFSRSIIQPHPVPGVTWARASYDSVRGRISCSWKESANRFHMEVTVPANTTATVFVPSKAGGAIRITYPATKSFSMIVSQKQQDGYAAVPVSSGQYVFDSLIR